MEAMTMIQSVWTDDVPVLAPLGREISIRYDIVNRWGTITSGIWTTALAIKGPHYGMEEARKVVPLLSGRDSKPYTLLAG